MVDSKMKRSDLLKKCKYYKGKNVCPYTDEHSALFWRIEAMYVDACSVEDSKYEELLTEAVKTYLHYELQSFEAKDGVPIHIKALILNRHFQYMEREDEATVADFKKFYKEHYGKK